MWTGGKEKKKSVSVTLVSAWQKLPRNLSLPFPGETEQAQLGGFWECRVGQMDEQTDVDLTGRVREMILQQAKHYLW